MGLLFVPSCMGSPIRVSLSPCVPPSMGIALSHCGPSSVPSLRAVTLWQCLNSEVVFRVGALEVPWGAGEERSHSSLPHGRTILILLDTGLCSCIIHLWGTLGSPLCLSQVTHPHHGGLSCSKLSALDPTPHGAHIPIQGSISSGPYRSLRESTGPPLGD